MAIQKVHTKFIHSENRLQILAPGHAKLDIVRVHTTVLGERHTKLISVLGDRHLARNVLVDFDGNANAFDAGVVDGGLVGGSLGACVNLGLQSELDITIGVADVNRGVLARHIVLNGRGDVIDVELVGQVELDRRAVGVLLVTANLGALLRERHGDIADGLDVGVDLKRTGLAL